MSTEVNTITPNPKDEILSPINMEKNLQFQFKEASKNQLLIRKRCQALWSWHGTETSTCQFKDY